MGCASSPVKYEKTCVLLLGWADEVDDIEAGREVSAALIYAMMIHSWVALTDGYQLESLQEVFETFYKFSVQFKRLHLEKHPQVQAAKHVADFIHDEDDCGRLLIIYYGGHGDSEATAPGRIKLAGRIPDDDAERDMCIEWNDIESSVLTKTKADVLVIFDCCYAGVLCRPAFRGPRRTFQYVAACKAWQRTKSAGPESFTSAMIWALRNLAYLKESTVGKFVDTLMEHESFPRDTQEAVVYGIRFGLVDEDIWISETQTKGAGDSGVSSTDLEQRISSVRNDGRPTADILDLRFDFSEPATKSNIEDTARALKKLLLANEDLRFHRITLLDHASFLEWPVKHWLRQTRMKKTGARAGPTPVVSTEDSKDADSETKDDQRCSIFQVLALLM